MNFHYHEIYRPGNAASFPFQITAKNIRKIAGIGEILTILGYFWAICYFPRIYMFG